MDRRPGLRIHRACEDWHRWHPLGFWRVACHGEAGQRYGRHWALRPLRRAVRPSPTPWPGASTTEVDVYLDPAWATGEGFDYSVAMNRMATTPPATSCVISSSTSAWSTTTLLVNASNNTDFTVNPANLRRRARRSRKAGWYTLQHVFTINAAPRARGDDERPRRPVASTVFTCRAVGRGRHAPTTLVGFGTDGSPPLRWTVASRSTTRSYDRSPPAPRRTARTAASRTSVPNRLDPSPVGRKRDAFGRPSSRVRADTYLSCSCRSVKPVSRARPLLTSGD